MSYREICERFMHALAVGDFTTQNQILAADFVCVEAAGLPYGGEFRGPDGWKTLAQTVGRTWSGFRLELLELVAETGTNVVWRFSISGKSRKTGVPFESTVMELWRFKDEKLAEILPYYFDTHLLNRADAEDGAG